MGTAIAIFFVIVFMLGPLVLHLEKIENEKKCRNDHKFVCKDCGTTR